MLFILLVSSIYPISFVEFQIVITQLQVQYDLVS